MENRNWKEYKLSDICNIISTKTSIQNATLENYISTENMINDFGGVQNAEKLPTTNTVNSFFKDDILFSNIRTYFKKVWYAKFDGTVSQDVLTFRAKEDIFSKFLYYILCNPEFTEYTVLTSKGAKMPRGDKDAIKNFELQLPPLPEQKAIASVLSSLDDKIDLLHQQNQTLEALAETLFRQWFIERRPEHVEGEAKEDLENCTIGDLCIKINSGGTPSTKIDSYYNGNINWYSTKELNDNFLFSSNSKITQEGLDNSSAKIFPAGTVVIAIYAAPTVGRLGILTEDSAFNQAACGLVANDKICSKEFLYLYLKNQRVELNLMASGSAQQNLNVGKIKSYPCFIPDSITMEKFKFQVIPLFSKVLDNSKQIQTLTQLRDTLLPKLMSGEVRVEMQTD